MHEGTSMYYMKYYALVDMVWNIYALNLSFNNGTFESLVNFVKWVYKQIKIKCKEENFVMFWKI